MERVFAALRLDGSFEKFCHFDTTKQRGRWLWQIQGESLDSLERLWVHHGCYSKLLEDGGLDTKMTGPVVKSLFGQQFNWPGNSNLHKERFSYLEHLADVNIFDGLEHLLHLKYISGNCMDLKVVCSVFFYSFLYMNYLMKGLFIVLCITNAFHYFRV